MLQKLALGTVLGVLSGAVSTCDSSRVATAPSTQCSATESDRCSNARASIAAVMASIASCTRDSDCTIADRQTSGLTASPCTQNPTSAFFCPFAARVDADFQGVADRVRAAAADGEMCVTCSGTPCASLDCARPGTLRAACNVTTNRCELRP